MKRIYSPGTRSYRQLIGGLIGIFLLAFLVVVLTMNTRATEEECIEEMFDAVYATFNMSGGTIEGNISTNTADEEESAGGGGVFVGAGAELNLSENAVIKENVAMNGGGIYTEDTSYQDVSVGAEVSFAENYAHAGWWIYDGVNPVGDTITQIETRSMSEIADLPVDFPVDLRHPLNNNDINYRTEYTITILYKERSGDELIPLRVSDEKGNLNNKANVYNRISAPIRRYEPDEGLVHLDDLDTLHLTGWIDGDGEEVAYRANDPGTRPVLHYIHTDRTLTLIYEEIFIITEEHYKIGQGLAASREFPVRGGATYLGIPRNFSGYRYIGYRIDGRGLRPASSPEIVNIRANHTVRMIYMAEPSDPGGGGNSGGSNISGGGGGSSGSGGGSGGTETSSRPRPPSRPGSSNPLGPSPEPQPPGNSEERTDYGNYEFIKNAQSRRVSPGDIVGFTFSDFGNRWGVPLENFMILDRPDRGLDIVGGRLPAFSQGNGVYYTIYYHTRRGGERKHTVAENVSANRPFSFQIPRLSEGDYVTMLVLQFGEVPAGFAMGDTFQLDFRIWDNPPARTLTNIASLSYRVNGRYKEFVTASATGTVHIGGWFTSPLTGDGAFEIWYLLMKVAIFVMLAVRTRSFSIKSKRS